MLGSMAMAATGALGATAGNLLAAETKAGASLNATVRDRLWIFAVYTGANDSHLKTGNGRGGSRITPAEGAFWLGVPNLLFIRAYDVPHLSTTANPFPWT